MGDNNNIDNAPKEQEMTQASHANDPLEHLEKLAADDVTISWVFDFENAQSSDELEAVLASAPTEVAAALALGRLWGTREAEHAGRLAANLHCEVSRIGAQRAAAQAQVGKLQRRALRRH